MAEFCYECTEGLGVPGHQNDFAGMGEKRLHAEGRYFSVLCEGCGGIQVDWEGKRVGPNPVKLGKELNAAWRKMSARNNGHLIEIDSLALQIMVGNALKASGYEPSDFIIEIGIDEDNPTNIDWSYSRK